VWTIIFPAGIISARFFHHVDPVWWHLHRAFQGFGFIVFAIALGLGLQSKSRQSGAKGAHTAIAIALLVAVVLQVGFCFDLLIGRDNARSLGSVSNCQFETRVKSYAAIRLIFRGLRTLLKSLLVFRHLKQVSRQVK
jgi:hypothetical protein